VTCSPGGGGRLAAPAAGKPSLRSPRSDHLAPLFPAALQIDALAHATAAGLSLSGRGHQRLVGGHPARWQDPGGYLAHPQDPAKQPAESAPTLCAGLRTGAQD